MKKPWTAQETETLISLYGLRMNTQISEVLPGRSVDAIKQKGRYLGLKSNRKVTRKHYGIDYDYFAVPNVQNSYWAGFIAADGCIDDVKDRVRSDNSTLINQRASTVLHRESVAPLSLTLQQGQTLVDNDSYDNEVRRCDWWPNVFPKQK